MELAIDTSTAWGGIALSHEGALLAELTWKPGQNHTTELFPNIERLLQTAGADIKSITAIFVATGPGSFNGLRAGISASKGLAFSLDVPLAGISTLEAEAFPFAFTGLPICPMHDAGRGEIAVALFSGAGGWHRLKDEHLATAEVLCTETETRTLFCGEIPDSALDILRASLGDMALIPDPVERQRRPCALARLGWQRLLSGPPDNPATLQPIYLRQPPITRSKKKY